ncbi:hypothetical protein LCGC14_1138300 [marine sediment metagenome]|uniref:Uncharacterized protein n=1 Tax=marine sediment metagenome TaxID=412755 RepID=A0A0F9Q4T2_9ZZZZ
MGKIKDFESNYTFFVNGYDKFLPIKIELEFWDEQEEEPPQVNFEYNDDEGIYDFQITGNPYISMNLIQAGRLS